jgi:hypothetical protein
VGQGLSSKNLVPKCTEMRAMIKHFGTADHREVKYGRLVGNPAPTRRTPGRTEILKRGPSNRRLPTAGRRKFVFGAWVGLGKAFRVNIGSD